MDEGDEAVKSKDIPQEIRACGQVALFKQDLERWRTYYEEQLENDQAQVEKDNRVLEATEYMMYAVHDLVRLRTMRRTENDGKLCGNILTAFCNIQDIINKFKNEYENGEAVTDKLSENTTKYEQRRTREESMHQLFGEYKMAISSTHREFHKKHDELIAQKPDGPWPTLPLLDFEDLNEVFTSTLRTVKSTRSDRDVYGQKVTQAALMFADDAHYHLPGLLLPETLKTYQPGHLGVSLGSPHWYDYH